MKRERERERREGRRGGWVRENEEQERERFLQKNSGHWFSAPWRWDFLNDWTSWAWEAVLGAVGGQAREHRLKLEDSYSVTFRAQWFFATFSPLEGVFGSVCRQFWWSHPERVLQACMPLNILQCTGQPSTIKSFPVHSVSSAEFEKPCRALNEQRSHSGNPSVHEFSNWQLLSYICISLVCKAILLGSNGTK